MIGEKRDRGTVRILLAVGIVMALVLGYFAFRWWTQGSGPRQAQVFAWFRDPSSLSDRMMQLGQQCEGAPFIFPTDGLVGFLWGDSFRPGHAHQGIDIFPGVPAGEVPVVAAYDGYLTRLPEWKSTVIIRIPDDPLRPGRQIWTYYTHMADRQGNSFVSEAFPPGTTEAFVPAGTFLGYQGNFSGEPGNPTGVHLHFSIVMDDGSGRFMNELEIRNTYDPSPYLGLDLNADENPDTIPVCETG
ncbi:MAG: M23 family metallopeptidase [Anaerolineales bacterium]|nr:M23 family metallopeptidase [Anaerolineales bacterium]